MENMDTGYKIVDHLFRNEAGKMIAVLTRLFGIHNLRLAEDVVQEAFYMAVQTWKFDQLPENPAGWLMQTARNKAIDIIRKDQRFHRYSKELATHPEEKTTGALHEFFLESEIADSQLQLVFACCHPALKEEDRLAITLKTISGFGPKEISKALVIPEATVQKRLYRARKFLQENNIRLEIPTGKELSKRLETVYIVLYLLFNEGYNSIKADELIRKDLCAEAMRLCLLLSEHQCGKQPTGFALLSLMCFHASRFDSRITENNEIILLADQDRSLWNHELIGMGYYYLNHSSSGGVITVYHVEAAIAAEHALTTSFENTNWQRLLVLYDLLFQFKQTPMVILNRAIILSRLDQNEKAIHEVMNLMDIDYLLNTQYIFNAVLGDLYLQSADTVTAEKFFIKAESLTNSSAEKNLLKKKIFRITKSDQ